MLQRIYSGRLAVATDATSLPEPASASDGVAVPAAPNGGRPSAFVLFFSASTEPGAEAVIQGPVIVHAFDADIGRWFVAGQLNDSRPIDAVRGLEEDIIWRGGERIDVSAPGIVGATPAVTIHAVPLVEVG